MSLEITIKDYEKIIKDKLRNNQLLLILSVILGMGVFIMNTENVYWAMLFILIGALCLPNIDKCKKDLRNQKYGIIKITEGKVLDVFPEREGKEDSNWIIFLEVPGKKKIGEFIVPIKPEIEIDSNIKIYHTEAMHVPTKIEICST